MGKLNQRGDIMRLIFLTLLISIAIFNTNPTFSIAESDSSKQQADSFMTGLQPENPKQAVELWVMGVKHRSGALQYALFSPSLKKKTKERFEQRGWGTGQSSPWVDNVRISKIEKVNDNKVIITITYDLLTSYKNFGTGFKFITVEKNPEPYRKNWFISNIRTKYNQYEAFTPAETVTN
jgi:hypothetical protein